MEACYGEACNITASLNNLISNLEKLRTVYPEGTLFDCKEENREEDNQNLIILNQTALGNAKVTDED